MSEAKTAVKAKADAPVSAEKSYDISALRNNCVKLLGVTTSTFDGAMQDQTGPLSISEEKAIIENWKKGVAH